MKYDKLKIGDVINVDKKNIENREENFYSFINLTEEELVEKYFDNYKENLLYNINRAYQLLDSKYSTTKFKNQEELMEYAKINIKEIFMSRLDQYRIEKNNNYIKYVCIDQNGRCYIFYATSVMQYTVMLDEYTIPTDEFVSQYNSCADQGKVALNIDRFFKAINDKSYYFAYNLLSEGFRNNHFGTQEDFEKYIEKNFFENNTIKYNNFTQEAGLCSYKITITNSDNPEESIEKTIVMKLKDSANFELSFNMD